MAPTGVLRAAINLSNFLLVSSRDEAGEPEGVSPSMAKYLASRLGVPVKMITYPGPGPLADDVTNWDIGNIANEKERAKTIKFSGSYCNIQEAKSLNIYKYIDKVDRQLYYLFLSVTVSSLILSW